MSGHSRIFFALAILLSGLAIAPQVGLVAGTVTWERFAGGYQTPTPSVTATTPKPTMTATPSGPACTHSHGYWKNHPDEWPVTTLTIGGETYNQAELLQILTTPPRGDATYLLARQLIAAKLNIANGSDPTDIAQVIADADAWLMEHPLGSDPRNPERREGIRLMSQLARYNGGGSGPGPCNDGEPEPPFSSANGLKRLLPAGRR
jgi:hypothetical protein